VLLVAWVAVLAAVVAIGLVLRASLALSDRRGRFVSAVTHELRTPLTTFCLYSQMLADGLVEGEERRAEYLRTLRRESDRLASIVENVLVYARAAGRRREVEPSPVEGLVRRVIEEQGPAAARAGMSLELDMEGVEGLQVGVDGPSLERILGNLIENACRYASGASDRRITVRVRPEGRGVEVRVRDRGPGVAWRERHRVFMPFARGRDRRGEESGGLGLGLALARSVARSLGGEVRLARPGAGDAGAEFVVWLPANNPPAGA
jgi:signal transduction histidine kinase